MLLRCRIEGLVKKSGLQKAFIAEKLDVSVKQLRNYETGHSLIPIEKAYILAKLLGCWVDDLYEEIENKPFNPAEEIIEELNFSTRTYQALKRGSIHSVEDLLNADLHKIKGIGVRGVEEIDTKLKDVRKKVNESID